MTLFLSTLPSQKQLKNYYVKQFSYRDGLLNEENIRKRGRVILRKIKQLVPNAKTIVDVGCGYGFFLDEAQKQGVSVFGVEPSRLLVHYAFNKYAIRSFRGTLNELVKNNKRKFDVVTCIHVIEHVTELKYFVLDLLKLVKPGGLLYIETPNADSHLLYTEKEQYTFLIPPDHLWLFSRRSIQYLLPKNAQIVFLNTYSYSEHFMGIVKRTIKNLSYFERPACRQGRSEKSSVSTSLDSSAIPLNDNAFVIMNIVRKKMFYFLFDRLLAPLFTGLLNSYHKGSILELYIKKK